MRSPVSLDMAGVGAVKVAVRVRPWQGERERKGRECVVQMQGQKCTLTNPKDGSTHSFGFDFCYWSVDDSCGERATQATLHKDIGGIVLHNAYKGFNCTIFAYGQTGAGKTFSMMGVTGKGADPELRGLIPRISEKLFHPPEAKENTTYAVKVSFLEIYSERMKDLLAKGQGVDVKDRKKLKVRDDAARGIHVPGLTEIEVHDFKELERFMNEGGKERTVAATKMNHESSRSHAVFTITFTQTFHDDVTGMSSDTTSKIQLVDLAGSERVGLSGVAGQQLKEASAINKSLSALGMVIAELAKPKSKNQFVPYRNSVLTWLLKESLGGNSKTVMLAALSPSHLNFNETLSTLRYAARVRNIVNTPIVNEDANAQTIRLLRAEIQELKAKLAKSNKSPEDMEKDMAAMRAELLQSRQERDLARAAAEEALREQSSSEECTDLDIEEGTTHLFVMEGEVQGVPLDEAHSVPRTADNHTSSESEASSLPGGKLPHDQESVMPATSVEDHLDGQDTVEVDASLHPGDSSNGLDHASEHTDHVGTRDNGLSSLTSTASHSPAAGSASSAGRADDLHYQRLATVQDILGDDCITAFACHDKFLCMGTLKGKVHVLDLLGHAAKVLERHAAPVLDLAVNAQGDIVASTSADCSVLLTGLYDWKSLRITLPQPQGAVCFSADTSKKRTFIVGGADQHLSLVTDGWRGHTVKALARSELGSVGACSWQGDYVAWASAQRVRVLHLPSRKHVCSVRRSGDGRGCRPNVAWLPGRQPALLVGWARQVSLLQLERGANADIGGIFEVVTCFTTTGPVCGCCFLGRSLDALVLSDTMRDRTGHKWLDLSLYSRDKNTFRRLRSIRMPLAPRLRRPQNYRLHALPGDDIMVYIVAPTGVLMVQAQSEWESNNTEDEGDDEREGEAEEDDDEPDWDNIRPRWRAMSETVPEQPHPPHTPHQPHQPHEPPQPPQPHQPHQPHHSEGLVDARPSPSPVDLRPPTHHKMLQDSKQDLKQGWLSTKWAKLEPIWKHMTLEDKETLWHNEKARLATLRRDNARLPGHAPRRRKDETELRRTISWVEKLTVELRGDRQALAVRMM